MLIKIKVVLVLN